MAPCVQPLARDAGTFQAAKCPGKVGGRKQISAKRLLCHIYGIQCYCLLCVIRYGVVCYDFGYIVRKSRVGFGMCGMVWYDVDTYYGMVWY